MDSGDICGIIDRHRIAFAFFLLGICNNYAYFIMFSAAEDIVNGNERNFNRVPTTTFTTKKYFTTSTTKQYFIATTPSDDEEYKSRHFFEKLLSSNASDKCHENVVCRKCTTTSIHAGIVVMCNALPAFFVQFLFAYFVDKIPFVIKHFLICCLQIGAYLAVGFSTSIVTSLIGVVLASIGVGLGEITYPHLPSYNSKKNKSAWSIGTGISGLIASIIYAVLTEPNLLNLSPKIAFMVMQTVPSIFVVTYWIIPSESSGINQICTWNNSNKNIQFDHNSSTFYSNDNFNSRNSNDSELLNKFLKVVFSLPITFPLIIGYCFEHIINQGLTPLIAFDCSNGLHLSKASQYRWYQSIYHSGVSFSRLVSKIIKLPCFWFLYLPLVLQALNVLLFTYEALNCFIPSILIIFAIICYEGIIGGLTYANTYHEISEKYGGNEKKTVSCFTKNISKFAVGLSGIASYFLHNFICN
uniref:Battenin n=1 Tax=Strongyloides papillosus TaxID=174720 RepID=A0A0N5BD20_STREA